MKLPTDYIDSFISDNGIDRREFARISGIPLLRLRQILEFRGDIKKAEARKMAKVIGVEFEKLLNKKIDRKNPIAYLER